MHIIIKYLEQTKDGLSNLIIKRLYLSSQRHLKPVGTSGIGIQSREKQKEVKNIG